MPLTYIRGVIVKVSRDAQHGGGEGAFRQGHVVHRQARLDRQLRRDLEPGGGQGDGASPPAVEGPLVVGEGARDAALLAAGVRDLQVAEVVGARGDADARRDRERPDEPLEAVGVGHRGDVAVGELGLQLADLLAGIEAVADIGRVVQAGLRASPGARGESSVAAD